MLDPAYPQAFSFLELKVGLGEVTSLDLLLLQEMLPDCLANFLTRAQVCGFFVVPRIPQNSGECKLPVMPTEHGFRGTHIHCTHMCTPSLYVFTQECACTVDKTWQHACTCIFMQAYTDTYMT